MDKIICTCGIELGQVVEQKRWSAAAERIVPHYVFDRYYEGFKVARFFGRGEIWCSCGERTIWDANQWKLDRLVKK